VRVELSGATLLLRLNFAGVRLLNAPISRRIVSARSSRVVDWLHKSITSDTIKQLIYA
jgi:hypothetical protein